MPISPLFGRTREMRIVEDLIAGAGARGAALVVRGDPGIGKSVLLGAAGERARDRGMQVLTTSGVQSEAHLPFAGLHVLLRPILDQVDDLPAPQRDGALGAVGMTAAAPPLPFLIALAALDVIADSAARSPVLLIVEDAHWLDQASVDVLA